MSTSGDGRAFCPVCSARFAPPEDARDGAEVVCPICGQRLAMKSSGDGWMGERVGKYSDQEILDRIAEFARIRGYSFNEMRPEIVEGLLEKRNMFGDFYCPCRLRHDNDHQCPCKPTRGGDVEREGRCHCGLFWKGA